MWGVARWQAVEFGLPFRVQQAFWWLAVVGPVLTGLSMISLNFHWVTDAVVGAAHALGHEVAVMTQPGGVLARIAADHGLVVIAEGFADRRTNRDGTLVPRSEPNALITDPAACAARARDLAGDVDIDGATRADERADTARVDGREPAGLLEHHGEVVRLHHIRRVVTPPAELQLCPALSSAT